MGTSRSWSPVFRFFTLVGLVFLGIATLGLASHSSKSESASGASPSTEVELICHTDNSADCYPRIFQATDEFQTVHDDQDLPPGLHVRLNIQTGQKEAKINVPDEEVDGVAGLPVDSSVVVVDPENAAEEQVQIPAGAPAYDEAGKIKQPSEESSSFYESLKFIKKGLNLGEALESLEDISHDIYYGLKIAEDYGTVESLFCLANSPKIFEEGAEEATLNEARLAALTIAGAVQNNAKSLAEMEKHWTTLKAIKCPGSTDTLGKTTFRLVAPKVSGGSLNNPSVARARASAIRGLIKSPMIRKDFLENGGMGLLLEALVSQGDQPAWEPVQKRVAQLVQDHFLDENMGAALGEWPRVDQAADHSCQSRTDVSEECWDWEVNRLVKQHGSDKGHWSVELAAWLKEARKAVKAQPRARDEL